MLQHDLQPPNLGGEESLHSRVLLVRKLALLGPDGLLQHEHLHPWGLVLAHRLHGRMAHRLHGRRAGGGCQWRRQRRRRCPYTLRRRRRWRRRRIRFFAFCKRMLPLLLARAPLKVEGFTGALVRRPPRREWNRALCFKLLVLGPLGWARRAGLLARCAIWRVLPPLLLLLLEGTINLSYARRACSKCIGPGVGLERAAHAR